MKDQATNQSRRHFLKRSSVLALPTIIPASALGKAGRPAPSERMTLGCIGTGNNGVNWMRNFMGDDRVQVVSVCDVCEESAAYWANSVRGRGPAKKLVEEKYGKGCKSTEDFRELLADREIDAVQIATPDHWHGIQVVAAARAGKHIYGQKPLSLTVEEGRAMSDAVKSAGVTFQTGSQQRSSIHFRKAIDLVRNGYIGKVHTVKVGLPGGTPDYSRRAKETGTTAIPDGLNYDLWLGPAPEAPFSWARLHVNWRWLLDYSGGQITDWGAHHIDIAQWAMGKQLTGPTRLRNFSGEFPKGDSFYNTATRFHWECEYADGLKMVVNDSRDGVRGGVTFEGENGNWIWVNRGRLDSNNKDLLRTELKEDDERTYVSNNHVGNFVDCVFSGEEPIAPIEAAHRTITIAHLGNIALRLGREELQWDPDKEELEDDVAASKMLRREMRSPWKLT